MTAPSPEELLATWLQQEPGAAPPAGLEPEVVEAVIALRPERARSSRLTVEEVLALVAEGPFAREEQAAAEALRRALDDEPAAGAAAGGEAAEALQAVYALRADKAPPLSLRIEDVLAEVRAGPFAATSQPAAAHAPRPPSPRRAPVEPRRAAPPRRRFVPWLVPAVGALSVAAAALMLVLPQTDRVLQEPSPFAAAPAPASRSAEAPASRLDPAPSKTSAAEAQTASPRPASPRPADLSPLAAAPAGPAPAPELPADAFVGAGGLAQPAPERAKKAEALDVEEKAAEKAAPPPPARGPAQGEGREAEAPAPVRSGRRAEDAADRDEAGGVGYGGLGGASGRAATTGASAGTSAGVSAGSSPGASPGGAITSASGGGGAAPARGKESRAADKREPMGDPAPAESASLERARADTSRNRSLSVAAAPKPSAPASAPAAAPAEESLARKEAAPATATRGLDLAESAPSAPASSASPSAGDLDALRAAANPIGGLPDPTVGRPEVAAAHAAAAQAEARGDDAGYLAALRPLLGHAEADIVLDTAWRIARRQLALGQARSALSTIRQGLARGGSPLQRARLLALEGQAYERLGNAERAADSYRRAAQSR